MTHATRKLIRLRQRLAKYEARIVSIAETLALCRGVLLEEYFMLLVLEDLGRVDSEAWPLVRDAYGQAIAWLIDRAQANWTRVSRDSFDPRILDDIRFHPRLNKYVQSLSRRGAETLRPLKMRKTGNKLPVPDLAAIDGPLCELVARRSLLWAEPTRLAKSESAVREEAASLASQDIASALKEVLELDDLESELASLGLQFKDVSTIKELKHGKRKQIRNRIVDRAARRFGDWFGQGGDDEYQPAPGDVEKVKSWEGLRERDLYCRGVEQVRNAASIMGEKMRANRREDRVRSDVAGDQATNDTCRLLREKDGSEGGSV